MPPLLYDALTTGRSVRICYVNGNAAGSERTIRPVACFAVGRYAYLKAHCAYAGELRTFRLDRITTVSSTQAESRV